LACFVSAGKSRRASPRGDAKKFQAEKTGTAKYCGVLREIRCFSACCLAEEPARQLMRKDSVDRVRAVAMHARHYGKVNASADARTQPARDCGRLLQRLA